MLPVKMFVEPRPDATARRIKAVDAGGAQAISSPHDQGHSFRLVALAQRSLWRARLAMA